MSVPIQHCAICRQPLASSATVPTSTGDTERRSCHMQALLAPSAAAAHARSETELCAQIALTLRACGIAVEEQLVCGAGMADLVTARRDAAIEVKLDLSRKQLYTTIGQVLLYRAAINPSARAIVVGYATEETAGLVDWAAELGVEVVC